MKAIDPTTVVTADTNQNHVSFSISCVPKKRINNAGARITIAARRAYALAAIMTPMPVATARRLKISSVAKGREYPSKSAMNATAMEIARESMESKRTTSIAAFLAKAPIPLVSSIFRRTSIGVDGGASRRCFTRSVSLNRLYLSEEFHVLGQKSQRNLELRKSSRKLSPICLPAQRTLLPTSTLASKPKPVF